MDKIGIQLQEAKLSLG